MSHHGWCDGAVVGDGDGHQRAGESLPRGPVDGSLGVDRDALVQELSVLGELRSEGDLEVLSTNEGFSRNSI